MQTTSPQVQLVSVGKKFSTNQGAVTVLENVSFAIASREVVGVVGRSGVGKTTLLNIVGGVAAADAGRLERYGLGIHQRLPFVFQSDGLLPWLSVRRNIAFPLVAKRMSAEDADRIALTLLDEFNLADYKDSYPKDLSGGMRKRVEIARALVLKSPLVLLDEPFSGLDYFTRHEVRQWLLDRLRETHAGALFVTHDLDDAIFLADRILVLAGEPARIVFERSIGKAEKSRPNRHEELKNDLLKRIAK